MQLSHNSDWTAQGRQRSLNTIPCNNRDLPFATGSILSIRPTQLSILYAHRRLSSPEYNGRSVIKNTYTECRIYEIWIYSSYIRFFKACSGLQCQQVSCNSKGMSENSFFLNLDKPLDLSIFFCGGLGLLQLKGQGLKHSCAQRITYYSQCLK